MQIPEADVYLAAPLLAEKFLSMDLYAADVRAAFQKLPGMPSWTEVKPDSPDRLSRLRKYWDRSVVYPRLIRKIATRKSPGLLHVLDHSYAHLCREHPRSVVTCHDIAEYRISQLNRRQFQDWRRRVEGMREARHIVAISNNTKADLIELLNIPPERISVVYCGVDEMFRPVELAEARRLLPEISMPELKILHVGTNVLRKNISVLIEALGELKRMGIPFTFVKAGQPFSAGQESMLEKAGVRERLVYLGFRPYEELPAIYSLCDIFAFPSTYEGFGRPILEAQACGTPVVLSDSSCMAEVGRDAAVYFPAADPGKLALCFAQLSEEKARSEWISRGIANAAAFTWEAHVSGIRQVYASVASEG